MKNIICFFVTLFLITLSLRVKSYTEGATNPDAQTENFIVNGGFEDTVSTDSQKPSNWNIVMVDKTTISLDAQEKHSGNQSLKIQCTDNDNWERAEEVVSVSPKTEYILSLWYKGQTNKDFPPSIYIFDISYKILKSIKLSGTDIWSYVELPFASEDNYQITVALYARGVGTVWYDDVALRGKKKETKITTNLIEVSLISPMDKDGNPISVSKVSPDWSWGAPLIQPWGNDLAELVQNYKQWIPLLANKYKIKAICLLPSYAASRQCGIKYSDDELLRVVNEAKANNMKILIYTSITYPGTPEYDLIVRQHPDWLQIDQFGNNVYMWTGMWLCPNSPAFTIQLNYLKYLVKKFGPDAIMIDGSMFYPTKSDNEEIGSCFCPYCQKAFSRYIVNKYSSDKLKSNFGIKGKEQIAIPTNRTSPLFLEWVRWRYKVLQNALRICQENIKRLAPNSSLVINIDTYLNWIYGVDYTGSAADVILQEAGALDLVRLVDKTNLAVGVSKGKSVWVYPQTWDNSNISNLLAPDVLKAKIASIVSSGSSPWYAAYGLLNPTNNNKESLEAIAKYHSFIEQNRELYTSIQSADSVAILFSSRNRDFMQIFKGNEGISNFWQIILNTFKLFQFAHIPYDIIDESYLSSPETLSMYEVIVLANVEAMSDIQIGNLVTYVANGGSLLVTQNSSLYNINGVRREEFGLHQIFKVDTIPHSTLRVKYGKGTALYLPEDLGQRFSSVKDDEEIISEVKRYINAISMNPPVEIVNRHRNVAFSFKKIETSSLKYILHLVNTGENNVFSPVTSIRVKMNLQGSIKVKKVVLKSPDLSGDLIIDQINYKDGILIFTIPELQIYDVIIVHCETR